jgi:threonine dehydrogenase-like Zn-dependent dehydrogenase
VDAAQARGANNSGALSMMCLRRSETGADSCGRRTSRPGTGQANVKAYNRYLRDLIIAGRAEPSFVVSKQLPLDDAPDAYSRFDKREDGYFKVVLNPGT